MRVVSIKKNPKYQAGGQPKKWLKGVELAAEWNVSPATISNLARREDYPLPSDVALGARQYNWAEVSRWRAEENKRKQDRRK
ncbi:hypothetical protein [Lactiplantibacillus plantarum]|uniref:hypothetical protein n=1 Tax=Lactiplantibacillus plantarum TaxID=1590 RepID=UPI001D09448E|nr:hypothetical protein [Lactiplantibacillus plantarum]MCB7151932.1 hypothetical protein [Lactiplantibacillus plantarum]MCB7171436.1 hypothetical protein [Lactiplantibacillus plantarum]